MNRCGIGTCDLLLDYYLVMLIMLKVIIFKFVNENQKGGNGKCRLFRFSVDLT